MNTPGNADASRVGQTLQPGRDVDAIAIDIPIFLYHIPQVDPDPEGHPGSFRQFLIPCLDFLLDLHGALNGIHHACELGKKAVAVDRHDTAPVALNLGTHDLEMGLQGGEGPRLILFHEAAVPCGVGTQDGGKLPLVFFSGQRDSPRVRKKNKRT
jgi:hypothetical protein